MRFDNNKETSRRPTRKMFLLVITLLELVILLDTVVVATKPVVRDEDGPYRSLQQQQQHQRGRRTTQRQRQRRLRIGDFDILNERWKEEGVVIPLEPTTMQQDILFIPLTVNLLNGTCQSLSIGDIDWTWNEIPDQDDASSSKVLESNFTIVDFGVVCSLYVSWSYTFVGTESSAQIEITNSAIETTFTLDSTSVPPPSGTTPVASPATNFNFTFDTCTANVNIANLYFTGDNPADNILNVLLQLLSGIVSKQVETQVCTIVQQLEYRFRSLLNNLTDTFLESSPTDGSNPFLEYEDTMIVPPIIQLIDFQKETSDNTTTGPGNSVANFLDSFQQFSGVSIIVSDNRNTHDNVNNNNDNMVTSDNAETKPGTTDSWSKWLFPQGTTSGFTIDLTNNMLLNGPNGFISALTNPNTTTNNATGSGFFSSLLSMGNSSTGTTSSNQPALLQEFFGIQEARVRNVTIVGLENVLSSFKGLKAIGNYTLELDLAIRDLQFLLDIELYRTTTSTPGIMTTQVIQVGFNTSNDASFRTGILAAINEEVVSSLKLGSFLHGSYTILDCLSSTLYDKLRITGFDTSSLGLQGVSFDGLQSPGMDRILTTGLDYIFAAFDDSVGQILSSLVTGVDILSFIGHGDNVTSAATTGNNVAAATGLLSQYNATVVDETCPAPVAGTTNEFVDVRDLFLPPAEAAFYGGTGTEPYGNFTSGLIDQIIPTISNYLNLSMEGVLFNYTTNFKMGLASTNRIEVAVSDFRFVNQGLRNDSTIFGGVQGEPYETKNFVSLKNLELGGSIVVAIELDNQGFRSDIDVTVAIETLEVFLQVLSKLRETEFLGLPITSILDLSCWLSMFSPPFLDGKSTNATDISLAIRNLAVWLGGITLDLDCVECPTQLEKAVKSITAFNYSNDVTAIVDHFVTLVTTDKSTMIQSKIDELISGAPMRCPSKPEYNQSLREPGFFEEIVTAFAVPQSYLQESQKRHPSTAFKLLIACMVIAISLGLCTVVANRIVQKIARRRFEKKLETMQDEEILMIAREQMYEEMKQKQLDEYSGPLYKHDCVPVQARWLIPFVLLITSALFWCGLFGPFMAVKLFGRIGDEPSFLMVQVQYSISQIASLYVQKGNLFGLLIFFVSFNPAQTRIITTLLMWYLPTTKVSYAKRGTWLKLFDANQKIAILVLFIAIIGASVYQGTIKTRPITIQFAVVPVWAVFTILLGEIVCIAVTRYVIFYHDQIAYMFSAELAARQQTTKGNGNRTDTNSRNNDLVQLTDSSSSDASQVSQDKPCELYKSSFSRVHREYSAALIIRPFVQYGYVVGCLIAISFVLLGCTLSSFYYNVSGIIGVALNFDETTDQGTAENNVFTLARSLIRSAQIVGDVKAYVGLGLLAVLLVTTVFFAPIILSIIQIVRWVYPLPQTTHVRLRSLSQLVELWNFSDAYFFGIIICSQQGVQLTKFVASTYCKTFSNILRSLAYWGIIDETADECVVVDSKVHPTIFFFLGVIILLAFLRGFLECALEQRRNDEMMKKSAMPEELQSVDREALEKYLDNLQPPPVQFTDRFRWALRSEGKLMHL